MLDELTIEKPQEDYRTGECSRCLNDYPLTRLTAVDGRIYCEVCIPAEPIDFTGPAERVNIDSITLYEGGNELVDDWLEGRWYIVQGSKGRRPVEANSKREASDKYKSL